MRKLTGQFEIANWEEKSFLDVPKPLKAHEAEISYKVSGDLDGMLNGKYIMIYLDDKTAQYIGALQFTGSYGEKEGSFFVQETGLFDNNTANTNWSIIAGSGTDGFAEITGEGRYAATDKVVSFELEVDGV
ncbi:DUF3224 domain-containing protein [Maritalea sp.]|uniref:DUF3224 domain-containing protein n=1 Tax=Maritalea sp. TaxID=2003361 RepID=UPI003EF29B9B